MAASRPDSLRPRFWARLVAGLALLSLILPAACTGRRVQPTPPVAASRRATPPVAPQHRPLQLARNLLHLAEQGDCRGLLQLAPPGQVTASRERQWLENCSRLLVRELAGEKVAGGGENPVVLDERHQLVKLTSGAALLLERQGERWHVVDVFSERELGGE